KRASDALVAALKDPEAVVRARAAEALGRIGDAAVAPALAALVVETIPKEATVLTVRGDDPGSARDPWLPQRLALFALVRLKDVPAAETALLSGGRPRFDWWAATWAAMRLEAPALRPVLVAAASSSDPLSRTLAARGLGALQAPAALDSACGELSIGSLYGMLREPGPRVVRAVLEALRKARGPDSLDTLRRMLESPDFAVRAAAAEGLTELKASGQSDVLAAAYQRSQPDADLDARLALVAALAAQKDTRALDALRPAAARDPSRGG